MNGFLVKITGKGGCGGCRRSLLLAGEQLADLAGWIELVPEDYQGQVDLLLIEGKLELWTTEEFRRLLMQSSQVAVMGHCAWEGLRSTGTDLLLIPGCPPQPAEIVDALLRLSDDRSLPDWNAPVCLDCKQQRYSCLLPDQPCKGPITRHGCGARCPGLGVACRGCRGESPAARKDAYKRILQRHGHS